MRLPCRQACAARWPASMVSRCGSEPPPVPCTLVSSHSPCQHPRVRFAPIAVCPRAGRVSATRRSDRGLLSARRALVTDRFADWTHVPWIEVQTLLLDRLHRVDSAAATSPCPRQRSPSPRRQRVRGAEKSWNRVKLTRPSTGDIERSARAEVDSRCICSDHKEASCVARMIHVQVFLEVRDSAACLRGRSRPEHGIVYTQKRR